MSNSTRVPELGLKIPVLARALLAQVGALADAARLPAYAVGGCVRDWLLGISRTDDLDVTVEGDSVRLARGIAEALGGGLQVHEQFKTATVRFSGGPVDHVDVVMCRREAYAEPAAYPRVSPGTLEDDLFRRDFSINAMAADLHPARFGRLIDPFGGQEDARRKRIRVLHARSFLDDPSRILRAVKFAHRLQFQLEPDTRKLAREALEAGALGWLNQGRLKKELGLLQQERNPERGFKRLAELMPADAFRKLMRAVPGDGHVRARP
jgi:tRNA nucleotidyltransferase (CCA-adding enzyme)